MKNKDFLYKLSLFGMLFVTYLIAVSCSKEDVKDVIIDTDSVSIESATFGSYSTQNSTTLAAYYYFGANNTPTIDVEGYNEDYTYQLKLTGKYLGTEHVLSLNTEEPDVLVKEDDGIKNANELLSKTVPVDNIITDDVIVEDTSVSLKVDITNLDLEVDDYTATIVEVESEKEMEVISADALLELDANYKTYIVDNDATNFLSGTQLESDGFTKLTELNLNDHASFRVRPTIVNYINGLGIVLGIYDTDANKIGYVSSSGSNGSGAGTYSYKFRASDVNDKVTANGEYLVRLEERTSTIDANDTGYRNGLFQKINITKIVEVVIEKRDAIVALEAK